MLKEGRYLAGLAPNVVVKLPLTEAGLRACSDLSADGIKVNVTLCFSAVHRGTRVPTWAPPACSGDIRLRCPDLYL